MAKTHPDDLNRKDTYKPVLISIGLATIVIGIISLLSFSILSVIWWALTLSPLRSVIVWLVCAIIYAEHEYRAEKKRQARYVDNEL